MADGGAVSRGVGDVALALEGIDRRFGAQRALDGATLTVRRGTLHAVLGENGAGKTTLMRVAFGMVHPDAGTVRVDGVPRDFRTPADAIAAGVGMVHQHFTIVPAMTVAENVALGGSGRYDPRAAESRVRTLGEATGLRLDPRARAGSLRVAGQQRLEVLKALARDARLLILDEPAAVLSPAESEELLGWLRQWVDAGGTAVLVTHKIADALRHADDVTVLRRGRAVLTADVTALASDRRAATAALAAAMLGDARLGDAGLMDVESGDAEPGDVARTEDAGTEDVVPSFPASDSLRSTLGDGVVVARLLHVAYRDADGVDRLRDVSVELRRGELVGIAAVEGSGQHELVRLLAGRVTPTLGAAEHPSAIAFIPEDRHRDALLLDATLAENLALRDAGDRRGRMDWRRVVDRTEALIDAFDVRGGGARAPARTLSGGNQQKFVVGRELAADETRPALVVAENPTRGLDIRASAAVRAALRQARDAGAAVVVYSSDLDEVLALADRVLVVYDGGVRESPPDRELVGRRMLGG